MTRSTLQRPRRILVTGGAGFIGANLVRRLLDDDEVDEVRVIDDRSAGDHGTLHGLPVTDIDASILDWTALRSAVDGCDGIVHLAAMASVAASVASASAARRSMWLIPPAAPPAAACASSARSCPREIVPSKRESASSTG